MKILVNTSTLVVGGGVQVGLNFIKNTINNNKHNFYYLLSQQVYNQLSREELSKIDFYLATISPANRFKGKTTRNKILELEKNYTPDIVYSVGAPSYVNFNTVEVLRLTNPMVIGGTKLAFTTYSLKKKIIEILSLNVKRLYIKKAHHIITQTESAKTDIIKNLKVPEDQVFVISNVYSSIFDKKLLQETKDDTINILSFSAAYPHKNLDLIPEVAYVLKKRGIKNFKFIVTIPNDFNKELYDTFTSLCKKYDVQSLVENIGKVNFKDAPRLYQNVDLLFLPTLLEIFSVTYLEAMASSIPIITTDLPFATEVCEDAALYFKPKNAILAADQLELLIKNKTKRDELISLGKNRLSNFLKEDVIYNEHINVLEKIYKSSKNI